MKRVLRVYSIVAAIFLVAIAAGLLLTLDTGDFRLLEDIEAGGWSLHTYVGLFLFIFFILIILIPQLSKRVPAARNVLPRFISGFETSDSTKIKWWTMVVLGALGVYAYTYCHHICDTGGVPIFDCDIHFFHMLFRFSLSLFPYFIGGCIVGGLIMKYFSAGRFKLPSSMLLLISESGSMAASSSNLS